MGGLALGLTLAACGGGPERPGPITGPSAPVDASAPVRVALLVPLGSADPKRAALGRSLVNAARLAQSDLKGARIDLKVYPTAGDPRRAAVAATRAIQDGARIIVGPLFGVAAEAVGPIAARAGVKVLTFSTTPAVAGGNVFLLGQTADTEARRIVSYAASRGITALAIFYPRTPSGKVAEIAVRDAARRSGVTVVTAMDYPRSVEGIQQRSAEYAAIHSAPALVLPEGGQGLKSVAAFLAHSGVDAKSTRFLGLGQWNSPLTRTESALQGGWFVAPDPALFAAFASRYRAAYGTSPKPIASLAYDGIAAVGAMIRDARRSGETDPFSISNITDPHGFAGVNGIFRFRRDGLIDRALAVMEVGPEGFQVISPAPRSFAAFAS